jgi:hypothetical protein
VRTGSVARGLAGSGARSAWGGGGGGGGAAGRGGAASSGSHVWIS